MGWAAHAKSELAAGRLHLVSAADANRVQIANHRGRVNGWVPRTKVYAIAVEIRN